MIGLPFLNGHVAAVMGLGRSGLSAAKALLASGAEVWAWDDKEETRVLAESQGIPLVNLATCDWMKPEILVWSPGIPHTWPRPHPIAEKARKAGRPILCDIDLLLRARSEASYVAITGTNGKSTTTSLIGHIFKRAGRKVAVGGNLGTPALDLAPLERPGTYVLELSSYQLELVPSAGFGVAVLLNVTPDHLGRHNGMEGYVAAKRRIFDHQPPPATAIVGIDDEHGRRICEELKSLARRVVPISSETRVAGGVHATGGLLIDDRQGLNESVIDLNSVRSLPGRHNWQNAAAAYAAATESGLEQGAIVEAIRSFPGLAHRQEFIGIKDGIRFVNDSKATNADAAEKALVCYDAIYWIAGGQAKEGGINSLAPHFSRIRHAFLIGEATPAFAKTLEGRVGFTQCGDLATATRAAHAMAMQERIDGGVVLLSPACASWDQFKSFEERGDRFRDLVSELPSASEGA
ncbi:MAG: UDP-N-acetylmuramoyl-L-alanine--D-glutamate ligase [Alphaproteobacteria bacterium]|nr:UDP-N-acetylmuramoyl-L-alanine--D-glutamate ligase [Alphaproteobacteria bacterium]